MKRLGMVIRVRPGKIEEYARYHADVWPDVLQQISNCSIRNYSIYHKDGLLFTYLEYVGDDYEADMAKMAANPTVQKWWAVMRNLLEPFTPGTQGERLKEEEMEEVFHLD